MLRKKWLTSGKRQACKTSLGPALRRDDVGVLASSRATGLHSR